MNTKTTISLLTLTALMALATGVASANEVKIQTNNSSVTVSPQSGVKIQTTPTQSNQRVIIPTPRNRTQVYQSGKYPRQWLQRCHTVTRSNHTGNRVNSNSTYSQTTICQ